MLKRITIRLDDDDAVEAEIIGEYVSRSSRYKQQEFIRHLLKTGFFRHRSETSNGNSVSQRLDRRSSKPIGKEMGNTPLESEPMEPVISGKPVSTKPTLHNFFPTLTNND